MNLLRESESFAGEGVDVVDLRRGRQGAEDVGALGGDQRIRVWLV